MTTETVFDDHDLYLNYIRGGPGFGDPLDREPQAIARDLNCRFVLPEYAERVYGAVIARDEAGVWTIDEDKTIARRKEIRQARLQRAVPVREWIKQERERIIAKDASLPVRHMYSTSFGLSEKFTSEFKSFWDLPADWSLPESELGVPSFGAKYRNDLSEMPDVRTVVLVEE